jgi:hypothetical protein
MNANRDASQRTKNIRAKTLAANYHDTMNNINTATVMPVPRCYSDMSSSIHTQVVVGKMDCCSPSIIAPYTTYYLTFTTTGSTTWTAPATCQSPITYWIVGGGGGGGGTHDNAGAGGGGGGVAITGTYTVVAGSTYSLVVGAGGAGGTAIGSTHPVPTVVPGSSTNGSAGTNSSFDLAGGGPVAAGGGAGLRRDNHPGGDGVGGVVSAGGNGGSGGYGGGGGGGAGGSGTNGGAYSAGTGGTGISFTIPGYNGGNPQTYSRGGNGGANINTNFSATIGASGSANTGNGGGGGGVGSFSPPYAGGVITVGGAGGSGLVVIQYSA